MSIVDYEVLLRKYIRTVLSNEGVTFTEDWRLDDDEFTESEREVLGRIGDEVFEGYRKYVDSLNG